MSRPLTVLLQVKNAFLPQYLGQYSGPWHLAQAISGSQYVTTDIDAADIVYVYDYCYYTWWLAFVHSNGRVQREDATPGDYLLKGYQVLFSCFLADSVDRQCRIMVYAYGWLSKTWHAVLPAPSSARMSEHGTISLKDARFSAP